MHKIIVAGISTDVGKTVVSAILATLFNADYWKPIQCGEISDSDVMKSLLDSNKIHSSAYTLKAPLSPHHAARLDNISINIDQIIPPKTNKTLIIEGAGGIFVPVTLEKTTFDLFKQWKCTWIIVSKHYLGSINHTLLTINALKQHNIQIAGIIFNGEPNPDSESAILKLSNIPLLGRLLPEPKINAKTIQRYAKQWKIKI